MAQKVGSNDLVYFHQDHLTGTSVMSNASGATVSTVKYFPFGATRSESSTLPTDKKFTGQRLDSTGLYFYNARYYDPEIGRFVSADLLVPTPAFPQAFNRYAYGVNNPTRYTDPTGHCYGEAAGFRRVAIVGALCRGADSIKQAARSLATNAQQLPTRGRDATLAVVAQASALGGALVETQEGAVRSAAGHALEVTGKAAVALAELEGIQEGTMPAAPEVKQVIQVPERSITGFILNDMLDQKAITLDQTVITTKEIYPGLRSKDAFTPWLAAHETQHAKDQAWLGNDFYLNYLASAFSNGFNHDANPWEMSADAFAAQSMGAFSPFPVVNPQLSLVVLQYLLQN